MSIKNIEGLNKINKNVLVNNNGTDSFVVREPGLINGQMNTVNETNSKAGINSFKHMGKGNNSNNSGQPKRESIYKTVLMKDKPMTE